MNSTHSSKISSHVRRGLAPFRSWRAPNGVSIEFPLIVDVTEIDEVSGECAWSVEAVVDLVDEEPSLVSVHVASRGGLNAAMLQRHFRWQTPLDIVTIAMPELVHIGVDPFNYDFPTDGFPNAAFLDRNAPVRLTDAFLTEIATRYSMLGRGYARIIAEQRNVSPRTVVSWIEKARARGILSATRPGLKGGRVMDPNTDAS